MNIIFVRKHIVDDEFGIVIRPGRTGFLLDDTTGTIQLDEIDSKGKVNREVVRGVIDGVQPSCYIQRRE